MKNVIMDFLTTYRTFCKEQLRLARLGISDSIHISSRSFQQFCTTFPENSIFNQKSNLYLRFKNEFKQDSKSLIKSFAIFLYNIKKEYEVVRLHPNFDPIVSDVNQLLLLIKMNFTSVPETVVNFTENIPFLDRQDYAIVDNPSRWVFLNEAICKDKLYYTDKFPLLPYAIKERRGFDYDFLRAFVDKLCRVSFSKYDSLVIISDYFLDGLIGYLKTFNKSVRRELLTDDGRVVKVRFVLNIYEEDLCIKTIELCMVLEHNLLHYYRIVGLQRNTKSYDENSGSEYTTGSLAIRQGETSWVRTKPYIRYQEKYTVPTHVIIIN